MITLATKGIIEWHATQQYMLRSGSFDRFYSAYFVYFADVILKHGAADTLEQCLFSAKANTDNTDLSRVGKAQPGMLNRFTSGLFHPFIHTGLGIEFGIPGTVAEGINDFTCAKLSDEQLIRFGACRSNRSPCFVHRGPLLSKSTLTEERHIPRHTCVHHLSADPQGPQTENKRALKMG